MVHAKPLNFPLVRLARSHLAKGISHVPLINGREALLSLFFRPFILLLGTRSLSPDFGEDPPRQFGDLISQAAPSTRRRHLQIQIFELLD
jgi:hypothetical protein